MGFHPTDDQIDLLDDLREIVIDDILPLEQQGGFSNMFDDELELEADRFELEELHREAASIRDELLSEGVPMEFISLAETPGQAYENEISSILMDDTTE